VAAAIVRTGGRLGLMIGAAQVPRVLSSLDTFQWGKPTQAPGGYARVLLTGTKIGNVEQN